MDRGQFLAIGWYVGKTGHKFLLECQGSPEDCLRLGTLLDSLEEDAEVVGGASQKPAISGHGGRGLAQVLENDQGIAIRLSGLIGPAGRQVR